MLKKQSGAVLVVSLMILIILTVLVLSGTQSTLIQQKMTSAVRDAHISLEMSESGLKDAEKMIEGLTLARVTEFNNNSGGLYSVNSGPDVFSNTLWKGEGEDKNKTIVASVEVAEKGIVSRYFVEYLGVLSLDEDLSTLNMTGYGETTGGGNVHGFRISSGSTGRDGNTARIIVGYYAKSF